jgi:hypothetical protein
MIRFYCVLLPLVSLSLSIFPNLSFAQSTLTNTQIAKKFYPTKCQIIKGRIDNSSPVNISRQRYIQIGVTGESGLVMFAEIANTSDGMRKANLSTTLNDPFTGTGSSSVVYRRNFLPRESWQFSEKYPTINLSVVPPTIPSDYELMIVWAKPSPILSQSQVKKFAFSNIIDIMENVSSEISNLLSRQDFVTRRQNYDKDVNAFLEDTPVFLVDIKAMCDQVTGK